MRSATFQAGGLRMKSGHSLIGSTCRTETGSKGKKWMDCRFEKVGTKLGVEAVQSVDSFSLIPLEID